MLSQEERQEIFDIDPQSESSTLRLVAVGMRYKAQLPDSIKIRNLTQITAQAPEHLRREFDVTAAAKETAFKDYNNRNAEYNDICGEGCNPLDAEETALEGSRIHYLKQAIANPQQEITAISAFWQSILVRLPAPDYV